MLKAVSLEVLAAGKTRCVGKSGLGLPWVGSGASLPVCMGFGGYMRRGRVCVDFVLDKPIHCYFVLFVL
jgi:hypothetical protein